MSDQPFDSNQFKAGQRRDWDQVSAGWEKWWETFERGAQHVSDRLVVLAEVQPGHRVLDVATGIGEPAVTAARRWVGEILECAPLSVRLSKQQAMTNFHLPIERAVENPTPLTEIFLKSEDRLEGPRAFAEKRKPNWKGR